MQIAIRDIPVALIDDNPFNPRSSYKEDELLVLQQSLTDMGLLSPIQVREKNGRYEAVYGHRRLRAARSLNWKTIPAEVKAVSDQQMLEVALIENLHRQDLSDYQVAKAFRQLNVEFGLKLEEIGKIVGYSREHISNYVRMTTLFDELILRRETSLKEALELISEHHARLLLRIPDQELRAYLINLIISDNLSVRDLQRIIERFRGWFGHNEETRPQKRESAIEGRDFSYHIKQSKEIMCIRNILVSIFSRPENADYHQIIDVRDFDSGCYSIYDDFPPYERLLDAKAIEKQRKWFYVISPRLRANVRDIKINFLGETVVATMYVDYRRKVDRSFLGRSRGTVVFVRKEESWKIVHEHWSKLDQEMAPLISEMIKSREANREISI